MRGFAAIVAVVTLVGCQGGPQAGLGGQPSAPNETGVGPRATFALATNTGLLGAAADGTILGRIVDLPAGSAPSGAALQPGGKTLFFALSQRTPDVGFGSDIYSVNVDGTDLRPVVKRDQPNVFYASPTFDAKGNLYVHRREGDVSGANMAAFQDVKDSVERVDPATGRRQKVLGDAADPTVAPAGTHIIYMKMDRGQTTDLWIATTDGSKAEKFLKTDDWFSFLQAPRISPDGRVVTWSSVPPVQPKKSLGVPHGPAAGAGGKLAHLDIPSELFVAPLDGSSIRSIATTSDDVVPAWSPDGTRIAFVARSAFYIVSAADGALLAKTANIAASYGEPVWLKSI